MAKRRFGILTGGGDAPGLNGAIKSFVAHATNAGHEVIGLRRGWEALVQIRPGLEEHNAPWIVTLDASSTRTIDRSGGTVLHTTRLNPANVLQRHVPKHLLNLLPPPNEEGRFDLTPRAVDAVTALGLDAIVVIGGDGTLTFARRLDAEGVPVIAIPKTVDNDVFGTDYCIGFSTAVTRAVSFINDLRTSAGSHERILVVELFGRYSGETCLLASYLAGTDRCVIAEVPFDVDHLYRMLEEDRAANPSAYAVVAISEGARLIDGERFEYGEADGAGNRRLGGVGEHVAAHFERISGERVIHQRIAYLMRCGPPDSFDQLVAKDYGHLAADLAHRRETGKMVASVDGRYTAVSIQVTGSGQKRVDAERVYDSERCRPRVAAVLGAPMFHASSSPPQRDSDSPGWQAEEALRESQARNAAMVNAAIDGMITIDQQGMIVEFNPAAEQIFGLRRDEVIGREMAEIIIPARLRERHRRGIAHYLETGEGPVLDRHIEMPALRSDGSEFPVELAITRINQQGPPLFTGYIRDISERKRAEAHLKFLASASELFATSLDFDTTMKNIVTLAVPTLADWAVVDIAGREPDQPYHRLAMIHVDPAKTELARQLRERYPPDPAHDRVLQAIRTGRSELVNEVPEEILRASSRNEEQYRILKELGIVSWMIVPLRLRDVTLGAVSFVSSDSRRRFTESDLAHAEEFARRASMAFESSRLYRDAQEANRAKDNFLATLSHELRTPMTSILGWSRMLADGNLDDETTAIAVDAIQRGATVQADLIEDVLDMSRIVSGKMRLDVRMIDLAEIAEAALATVEPAAEAKGIAVQFENEGTTLMSGDSGRLQQVLWNLLTNAIKFTPRGGRVDVRVEQTGSSARVTVSDTGQGFAREFGAHLFEPFRQAESATTRSHGGLGLGLSIVRHLVEQHGGEVTAESPGIGQGATFRVTMPLRALSAEKRDGDDTATRRAREGGRRAASREDELENLHVLFVDDQEEARTLIRTVLERCGARVTLAQSVSEAIDELEKQRFDIVVTDIAMPERDGFELIEWLNERPDRNRFRIVALTAFAGPDDRGKVLGSGCDDFLKKPVDPADLVAALAKLRPSTTVDDA
ncbi:MAG TPA: 6-phosphofructokinase [Thermoanaerobaculia bacterium]|nr:6-phosphofructokinase [Thermoanaerobaculia bacterium]